MTDGIPDAVPRRHETTERMMMKEIFDTGDVIHHKPSGEDWVLAYCRDGRVCCCGWPESMADANDCELIRKGTPEERQEILIGFGARCGSDYDSRESYARNYFHELATSTEGAGI